MIRGHRLPRRPPQVLQLHRLDRGCTPDIPAIHLSYRMVFRLDLAQQVLPHVRRRLLVRAARRRTHWCFRRSRLEDSFGGGRPARPGRLHSDFTVALLCQSLWLDCYVAL